jgi:hypothetical protein
VSPGLEQEPVSPEGSNGQAGQFGPGSGGQPEGLGLLFVQMPVVGKQYITVLQP